MAKSVKKVKSKTKALKKATLEPEILAPGSYEESQAYKEGEADWEIPDEVLSKSLVRPPATKIKNESALVPADPVARYMAEIRKYPLLTREEEHSLAVQFRESGDREAAQKLITSNLRFVVKVALEYSKFGARLIDLIQEGNIGLMQAVKEYNPYKGVRLITYAVWWIRGQIQEFLMRHYSMVRIGTTHTQRKLFYELQRSRDQLEKMGLESGLMQISNRLGVSPEEVREMSERVLNRDLSLDRPNPSEKGTALDITPDPNEIPLDEELGRREQLKILEDHIDKLRPHMNEREIYVLENRILNDEPLTLQEIGDKYGITREAARQMESRLIQKIREQMVSEPSNDTTD